MSIKLTLLKSGEQLISDMKELVAEGQNQPHAYLLNNPHTIDINHKEFVTDDEKVSGDFGINVSLLPWICLLYTSDAADDRSRGLGDVYKRQ